MKKYALLHIYLPQFAMSASLPLLSEHSTRSAPRNRSCFIIFPCPYCFLIVFDIYLIIFCYILLYFASTFDEISERTPQKASAVPRVLTKDELTSVQVRLEVFVSRMEGNICTTFPSRCKGVLVDSFSHFFPYLTYLNLIQSPETICHQRS